MRLLPLAEGARPVLFGFDSVEDAGQCVAAIIGAGIVPVAMEYMDKPAIQICENFAHAGYPLDVEAMLIIEVEGVERGDGGALGRIGAIAKAHNVRTVARIDVGDGERADLEGPQIGVRRDRAGRRLHLHGRHGADRPAARGVEAHRRDLRLASGFGSPTSFTPATATCIRWSSTTSTTRRSGEGRGGGRGNSQDVRRSRRLPDRRAWRRHREARTDGAPVHRGRARAAEAGARACSIPTGGSIRPRCFRSASGPHEPRRCRPEREADVVEAVRAARARRTKLDIVGGGTRAGLGRPRAGGAAAVERGDVGHRVSMRRRK